MAEEEKVVEDKRKNKFTLFLERNEIWFKTVLSLTVTVAALLVSLASYKTTEYQVKLSAITAEIQENEKQPFFSIEQIYDENKQQYIYGIINTGGQVRYSSISIFPYLRIYQMDNRKKILSPMDVIGNVSSPYINQAFIYLPVFYNYESVSAFDNCLIAFSDIWLETTRFYGQSSENQKEVLINELANDYFLELACYNNVDGKISTTMSSEIVYLIEIIYYNHENSIDKSSIWLGRSSDLSQKTSGNNILTLNESFGIYYQEANKNGYTFAVDSLNISMEDVLEECNEYIDMLFEEFGQIPEY